MRRWTCDHPSVALKSCRLGPYRNTKHPPAGRLSGCCGLTEKNPRMPSGEVRNYSYIQRRPLRITPLRACVMKHRTSHSGKNSAAHQRAQKIWMRCSKAGKLQQPLVSCEIVTSSLEILPRRPSDEAKNCASPCGENVSRTHGLGENSPAVSSCGENPAAARRGRQSFSCGAQAVI